MKKLILLSALLIQVSAQADLVSVFNSMENNRKGAFGLNFLQGANSRVAVNSGGSTPAYFLFQAAYRNDIGKNLAINHDFYVGNLFTTNYYELMGEYVYGDANSNHPLNHTALLANGAKAMPKAASMFRHWVLEKYYCGRYPSSALAKGFSVRGISGSEFEQEYADYFFDFYLSIATNEFYYLPAFLLAKDSPIGNSTQLNKARDLISNLWEQYVKQFRSEDPIMNRLYAIRNHIHNQLSVDVISEIDQFIADFPAAKKYSYNDLLEIRKILAGFFSFGPDKLVALADKIGASDIKQIAKKMMASRPTTTEILSLSNSVADLRTQLVTNKIPYEQKSTAFQLIINSSLLLNRLIISTETPVSSMIVTAILNTAYIEGLLVKDNWTYFRQELATKADGAAALSILPDMIEIANDTLVQAFTPSLEQWKTIDPKMGHFIDDTLKSSAINTASVIAQRNGQR